MELKVIHDRSDIKRYVLEKNESNFMYHLCNIEDGFYEYNQFYGLYNKEELMATAIFEIKYGFPILIGTSYIKDDRYQEELLMKINEFLPKQLYCHLNIGSSKYLNDNRTIDSYEEYYNMELNKEKFIERYKDFKPSISAVSIDISEKDELIEFLTKHHPGFMIEEKYFYEGLYYEIRVNNEMVSVCGIFSDSKSVIQIGNVCTHGDYRRRGLGESCLYSIIKNLINDNKHIVLNVKKNNYGALKLYEKVGFEVIGEFEEVNFI